MSITNENELLRQQLADTQARLTKAESYRSAVVLAEYSTSECTGLCSGDSHPVRTTPRCLHCGGHRMTLSRCEHLWNRDYCDSEWVFTCATCKKDTRLFTFPDECGWTSLQMEAL